MPELGGDGVHAVGGDGAHEDLEGDKAGLIKTKGHTGGNGEIVCGVGGGFTGGHFVAGEGAASAEVALGITALADTEKPEHGDLDNQPEDS